MKHLLSVFVLIFAFFGRTKSIQTRIVGGDTARAGQFPSTVAIEVTTSNSKYFCGGSLFDKNWILTAAQCANGATLFTLRIGSHILDGTDSNRETIATSEYVLHPEYEPTTLKNDIALIKLRIPISYSLYIQPTVLPWNPLIDGADQIAVGWGQLNDVDASLSNDLQYVNVTVLSNAECKLTYGNQIADDMVCIAGNYNQGTCTGDTGSPLYQWYITLPYFTTAIASFISGNGCDSTDPSGYTRVYPYNQWIRNVTDTPAPY